MEIVRTTAPIPVLEMKRKFTEDLLFEVDYTNSKFKGMAFLTYLSNLDIETNLLVEDEDSLRELVGAYLNLPVMLKNESLIGLVVNLLLIRNGLIGSVPFDPDLFFEEHGDKLDLWQERLDMLPLYAARCIMGEHFVVEEGEYLGVDETVRGINWIHCVNHPGMALYYSLNRPYRYSKYWFDEPTFAGKNLYTYFESPDNVLFVAAATLHQPEFQPEFQQLVSGYDEQFVQLMQG